MKQKIKEQIFHKYFDGQFKEIRFSDLPKDIQENDIIDICRNESFFSENESYYEHTELIVTRERYETDEEYQKRIEENIKFREELKQKRFEQYLKLKSEFENK